MKRTLVSLIVLTTASFLVGCSSTPQVVHDDPPYCYTDETVTVQNGQTVDSVTKLECTDKPRVEHFLKDVGVAQRCRSYQNRVVINGRYKNVKGFLCEMPDGSWQAVDGRYRY